MPDVVIVDITLAGNVNGIDTYDGYGRDFMGDLSKYLGPDYAGKYAADYIRRTVAHRRRQG